MNLVSKHISTEIFKGRYTWRNISDDNYWDDVGCELMIARKSKGINRNDIAGSIGVSSSTLARFEQGMFVKNRLWFEVTYRMVLEDKMLEFIRNLLVLEKYNYLLKREISAANIFERTSLSARAFRETMPHCWSFQLVRQIAPKGFKWIL